MSALIFALILSTAEQPVITPGQTENYNQERMQELARWQEEIEQYEQDRFAYLSQQFLEHVQDESCE